MGTVKYDVSDVPKELSPTEEHLTPNQESYIRDLLRTRMMPDEARAEAEKQLLVPISKALASRWITRLKELPRASSQFARVGENLPDVSDGRYAVVVDGVLKFYRIKKPTEGKWAGFVFIDAGRGGAHGDLQWTPVKQLPYKQEILDLIARDPHESGLRFGREVGVCYKCGRSLSDETSRAYGMGPDCREAAGY